MLPVNKHACTLDDAGLKDSDAPVPSAFYPRCSQPRCRQATLYRRKAGRWRIAMVVQVASCQEKPTRSDTGEQSNLVRLHWRHESDGGLDETGSGELPVVG